MILRFFSERMVGAFCTMVLAACASSGTIPAGATPVVPSSGIRNAAGARPPASSGIPNLPDLVTVIPFYTKPNETAAEQTKVIIPAEVGQWRGNFVLDLGDPYVDLNRTFLQPSPTGGIDSITEANRVPDPDTYEPVWVMLRLGTLVDTFTVPPGTYETPPSQAHPNNAVLGHSFGNFSWVFAPRLGNIGLCALESFETIIDYTHRRVVLIRLDQAGHRLAQVPAYTPKWSAPLLDLALTPAAKRRWWGMMVQPDGTLDTLDAHQNTVPRVLDGGWGGL